MSKVKLFIAVTLDGKIARPDGSVAWLEEYPNPDGLDYGYTDFYASIGTVVMGRKTYQEILGFDVPWPYADAQTLVVSSNSALETPTPQTSVIPDIDPTSLRRLTSEAKGDIWIIGGGQLIRSVLNAGLVDEMTLTIIPRVLGEGIALFPEGCAETHFTVQSAEAFPSGFVNLVYTRKEP
ncbi:dihydrofolate reductase [Neolewinella aurantiaca]|uniref:Dihydrofolate reductase n=1 Tax=Neolewinella aurantiaca TaxID=2602767 RepID=A0A5C7FSM0_9BACT|nr:dihydrofolate reductase family protein [Neolewinella aurantiaca]TXF89208.1 dihydrofolate reductase [Neolewinella aurantiaca]